MSMRWLCRMGTVLRPGEPRHVHRAGVRHRQHRSPQARRGQEERERQGAAPPENSEHGAKLACGLLLRKRCPCHPEGARTTLRPKDLVRVARNIFRTRSLAFARDDRTLSTAGANSQDALPSRPRERLRRASPTGLRLAHGADERGLASQGIEPGIDRQQRGTVVAAIHHPLHHLQRLRYPAEKRELPAVDHEPFGIVETGADDGSRMSQAVLRSSFHRGQL